MLVARHANATPAPAVKVLVADPDGESGSMYAAFLGLAAHEVIHATDGRDALVKVLEFPFALVITETQLPLIDGYELCELIRRDAQIRTMPIMVVTGDARPISQRRALIAGADVVLVKPCAGDELVSQAKRLMLKELDRTAAVKAPAPEPVAPLADAARPRGIKSRSHKRYDTTEPPVAPPALRCPSCDRSLTYNSSHIGGVSAREPEQWDYFTCPGSCGQFQYRQRTRRLQRV
jgi:CheY-like chemotaxis protein